MIGQSLFKLIPPDLHADVSQRVADGDTTPYESIGLREDGSTFTIEVRSKNVPYQGRDVRVAAIRDITERKKMEDALRKLSRAVEQSGSSILITGLDGTIEFVNPAFSQITGFTWEDAVGQNPRILKSGKTPPEVYEDLWETITRGKVWEGEFVNKKKTGEYYWEYATISPVKDADGNTTHFVAVKEDITQRKQAEAALQEAHDLLEGRVVKRTAELNETVGLLRQEVAERQKAEVEIRQRLVVDQALAAISTRMMQATDIQKAIDEALAVIGELTNPLRVYLFRFQEDNQRIKKTLEWCAVGVEPVLGEVRSFSVERVQWLVERLRHEGSFYVEDVSALPLEVQEEMAIFVKESSGPQHALPIYSGEDLVGFLVSQGSHLSAPGSEQNLEALEVVVGMLGSLWQRERVLETLEERIAARTRELSAFFDLATLASRTQSLEEILEPAITRIISACRCDIICIHQYSENGKVINLVAQYNLTGNERQSLQEVHLQDNYAHHTKALLDPLVSTNLAQENTLCWLRWPNSLG
jgi:PAS domain S-box-containing protein